MSCISFLFYIKPQPWFAAIVDFMVVFPFSSTSNHNVSPGRWIKPKLYFLSLLHQTTTITMLCSSWKSCISFLFYIKPQRTSYVCKYMRSCISFLFYIKPQRIDMATFKPISCISFLFYIKPQLCGW